MSTSRQREMAERGNGAVRIAAFLTALVLSAFLMAVAIDTSSNAWLGWFTLLPLFLSIRVLALLQAVGAGAAWGLSFAVFSALSPNTPISLTPESLVLLTAIPGLYAGLGVLITRRAGFSPWLLGLGWIAVEFALQPLSLHHGLLAGTQGNGLIVRTLGGFAGYVLVAFAVAYVNASLLQMLAKVCTSGDIKARSIPGGSDGAERRLLPLDVSHHLLYLLGPVQPRAPPAWNLTRQR